MTETPIKMTKARIPRKKEQAQIQKFELENLQINGLAVIPYPEEIRANFNTQRFLSEQKEYIEINEETNFVMGGFAAMGNPSSFHHPEIRTLRTALANVIKQQFSEHPEYHGKYIECLADRYARRKIGLSPSGEGWHRDSSSSENTKGVTDEIILGGWANLSDEPQYFVCVVGSHLEPDPRTGFLKISKEDEEQYKARQQIIEIPPRHILMFNEQTVHRVLSKKYKTVMERLFIKTRICSNGESLFGVELLDNIIANQSVFPLHVGTFPPVYDKFHAVCWKDRLLEFSQNIRPEFLGPSEDKKGNPLPRRVQRHMIGLREAGMELFPP